MIDAAIYLILGVSLFLLKSRIISILLLFVSGTGIVITLLNKIGVTRGGSNVVLAIIVFYCAIASVYATFEYHK